VRERGVWLLNGGRGDLVVEVSLVLPASLDERSKELLREFGRIHEADDVRGEIRRLSGTAVIAAPGSDSRPS
jgi:molecular chaperone DnaJ